MNSDDFRDEPRQQGRDAYGQRSGAAGGYPDRRPPARETRARRHPEPEATHDEHYRRWRDEQVGAMDRDYDSWRRHRFARDFEQWRAIRAAKAGLRIGSGPPRTHEERVAEVTGA